MDKLPEPEFVPDKTWPRLMHGTEPLLAQSQTKFYKTFLALAGFSVYKYWREVFFYKKNFPTFAAISTLFVFSSYNLAKLYTDDPYVLAAAQNNAEERKYINEYRTLYKQAKSKNIEIPDHLVL
jgi:hypothetical protein